MNVIVPTPLFTFAPSRTTVYADFTCPDCYLASVRTDRLIEAGHVAPDWRAVEHRPRLPLAGIRLSGSAQANRGREVAATRLQVRAEEEFETRPPGFLPNTRAAIAAYAEAYQIGVADRVRHLLFDAYWVQGADIGHPEVLRSLLAAEIEHARASTNPPISSGYVVSPQRGPVSTAAYRRIHDWQDQWLRLAVPVALTVLNPHRTACGPAALDALEATRVLAA